MKHLTSTKIFNELKMEFKELKNSKNKLKEEITIRFLELEGEHKNLRSPKHTG